jgi:hypothetical protein
MEEANVPAPVALAIQPKTQKFVDNMSEYLASLKKNPISFDINKCFNKLDSREKYFHLFGLQYTYYRRKRGNERTRASSRAKYDPNDIFAARLLSKFDNFTPDGNAPFCDWTKQNWLVRGNEVANGIKELRKTVSTEATLLLRREFNLGHQSET